MNSRKLLFISLLIPHSYHFILIIGAKNKWKGVYSIGLYSGVWLPQGVWFFSSRYIQSFCLTRFPDTKIARKKSPLLCRYFFLFVILNISDLCFSLKCGEESRLQNFLNLWRRAGVETAKHISSQKPNSLSLTTSVSPSKCITGNFSQTETLSSLGSSQTECMSTHVQLWGEGEWKWWGARKLSLHTNIFNHNNKKIVIWNKSKCQSLKP